MFSTAKCKTRNRICLGRRDGACLDDSTVPWRTVCGRGEARGAHSAAAGADREQVVVVLAVAVGRRHRAVPARRPGLQARGGLTQLLYSRFVNTLPSMRLILKVNRSRATCLPKSLRPLRPPASKANAFAEKTLAPLRRLAFLLQHSLTTSAAQGWQRSVLPPPLSAIARASAAGEAAAKKKVQSCIQGKVTDRLASWCRVASSAAVVPSRVVRAQQENCTCSGTALTT